MAGGTADQGQEADEERADGHLRANKEKKHAAVIKPACANGILTASFCDSAQVGNSAQEMAPSTRLLCIRN